MKRYSISDLEKEKGNSYDRHGKEYVKYDEANKLLIEAYESIIEDWKQADGDCDTLYCVHCSSWDEYQRNHDKDCVVLKAKEYLKEHN